MKMRKSFAALCVFACILGNFAGCGKQATAPTEEIVTQAPTEAVTETTAPQISEDAKLVMELMEGYLNKEQPSNMLTTYSFGLKIKGKDIPVKYFEDCRYTPNGEMFYNNSHDGTVGIGSIYSAYINKDEESCNLYSQTIQDSPGSDKVYENYLVTLNDFASAIVHHRNSKGEMLYSETLSNAKNTLLMSENYAIHKTRDSMSAGFSVLPNESFYKYLMDMFQNSSELDANFKVGTESIYYCNELVKSYEEMFTNGSILSDEWAKEHDCYTVSFDVDSRYFSANYPKISNSLFKQGPNSFIPGVAIAEYNKLVPFTRVRLDDGNMKVKLYFDKDTKQCMGETIDASECAGSMIEYINSLGWTESTDDTLMIEKQFGYGEKYSLFEDAERDPGLDNYDAFQNKIVSVSGNSTVLADMIKLDQYQVKTDMRNMLYEIWDGNTMAATVVIDYNDMENIAERLQGTEMETQEHGDFTVYMNEIPMSSVFDGNNRNNEDVGYVAIVEHQPGIKYFNRFAICAWDNEVLHDIIDHMTFVTTDEPAAA